MAREAEVEGVRDPREKRLEFYSEVVRILITVVQSAKAKEPSAETAKAIANLESLLPQMILFGSRDFLQAWHRFKTLAVTAGNRSPHDPESRDDMVLRIASLESLLLAARQDLGQQSGQQTRGLVATTFINDIDPETLRKAYPKLAERPARNGPELSAGGPAFLRIEEAGRTWRVEQIVSDPAGHCDWRVEATIGLDECDEAGELVLRVTGLRRL